MRRVKGEGDTQNTFGNNVPGRRALLCLIFLDFATPHSVGGARGCGARGGGAKRGKPPQFSSWRFVVGFWRFCANNLMGAGKGDVARFKNDPAQSTAGNPLQPCARAIGGALPGRLLSH
jgi:hypothetical protein